MLVFYSTPGIRSERPANATALALPPDIVWVDLLKPDTGEIAFVERTTGLKVPSLEELSEIETSSRLRVEDGALYLSAPLIYNAESNEPLATPVGFVLTLAAEWLPADVKPRLETVRQDVISLNDYDTHLVNKVQLLLDATLGLINIEQNNIIKVLAIVSVVGIPPTLVASMYGMNFRHMPELDWAWGYPYGLALIALSAVLPLLWFKWRGWF